MVKLKVKIVCGRKEKAMKKLFESADEYLKQSDWKDLTLIKFCLFAMGIIVGTSIGQKEKKPVKAVAFIVFLATYVPLMTKYFNILKSSEDDDFEDEE